MNTYCPFVEKHRPSRFEDIVLDPLNKQILTNIINNSYFPNMLFYGPPGTGKTTTIINVINAYNNKMNVSGSGMTIHLNASDERGIDIIRNQISMFVSSNPLFSSGIKFVILDEVDYMTKNAQQALRYLLQSYPDNIRFCLICNYISKIDDGLQNEFLKLRFNQLPQADIIKFLRKISDTEKLGVGDENLCAVQKVYNSDIRSMVNFMQTNQDMVGSNYNIITNDIWETIYSHLSGDMASCKIIHYILNLSVFYNIDVKNIITNFLNYVIRNYSPIVKSDFLEFVENIIHMEDDIQKYLPYIVCKLRCFM
jgi:DNA polymerase III delta prime subunit